MEEKSYYRLSKEEKNKITKGYIYAVKKSADNGIISERLSVSLKPSFDFRHFLVHRYWAIEDKILLENCRTGLKDFMDFIEDIEKFPGKIEE